MDIIITKVVAVPANIAIGLEHVKQNIGVPVQKFSRRTKPGNSSPAVRFIISFRIFSIIVVDNPIFVLFCAHEIQ
jgi:hypothetical protein